MSELLRGPVTVANLTAAAGVEVTVDGWWPCLNLTWRTPVPASITKITAQVRERGTTSPVAETVMTAVDLAAGTAKVVNGVSVGQHLQVRLAPAGAPGLPFQPTPWLDATTPWDALIAELDGLKLGCFTIVCGVGVPTRTDLEPSSLYVREDVAELWQYDGGAGTPAAAANIVGTDLKTGTNIVTLTGYTADQVVRFSKPLVADSGGLLDWDAYSAWPDDSGTVPIASPVAGQTWDNQVIIKGNNGGADTTLFTATLDANLYLTAATAFAVLAAQMPVTLTGYTTYKIIGPEDPNPPDNRGGLSILVEVLVRRWVKMSDLTTIKNEGVEIEDGARSLDFVGAALDATSDGAGNVTVTLHTDTDGTLAANSDDRVPTQKAVKTAIAAAVTGLMDLKGGSNCSANPNYPSALKGDAYVVSVAGKIGGAAGASVDVGDVYVASADNAGGTQASVGSSWFIVEHNLVGVALAGAITGAGLTMATARLLGRTTASTGAIEEIAVGAGLSLSGGVLAAAGGGGGGSGLWSAILSATPTASSTSLSNLLGTGAATSDLSSGLYIAGTSGGVGAYTTSVPATPYSITVLLAPADGGPPSIGWTDGTKIQFMYPSVFAGGTAGSIDAQNNSNITTFSATALNAARQVYSAPTWLKIRDDGTTVYFQYSFDGVHFRTHYSVAKASGYLGSSGYSHIFVGMPGGSGVQGMMVLSWTQGS